VAGKSIRGGMTLAYTITFWFANIFGIIAAAASLIFVGIMIQNYLKKRTVGTALLALMYFTFFLAQVFSAAYNFYSVLAPGTNMQKILIIIYFVVINLPNVFLYFFVSRHILKDNDIIKSLYSIVIIGVIFLMTGLFAYDLFIVNSEVFYELRYVAVSGFIQYSPTTLTSLPVYLPLVLLVQLRIVITMSRVYAQKRQKDPIKRRGFLFILLSVVSLFLSVFMTLVYTLAIRNPSLPAFVFIFIYFLRASFVVITVIMSYIGWILPAWFRRRIRQKTWISNNIKDGQQPSGRFVTSKTFIQETHIVKEVTET
jgi:hypothetical protein